MWPWRRRSPFESLNIPKKVFISHSYKDAEARKRLLRQLPGDIKPFVFPPIAVPPEQMISDNLLDTIRGCEGMIYLQGGASAQSFWVALERDYALRIGKSVFAFNPSDDNLTRDISAPLEMKVRPVYDGYPDTPLDDPDATFADWLLDYMKTKRFFNILYPIISLPSRGDDWFGLPLAPGEQLPKLKDIYGFISTGWDILIIWPQDPTTSTGITNYTQRELERALATDPDLTKAHTLVAIAESNALPTVLADIPRVQIYGDDDRSQLQRIDDLIVRLYWLIYRNTHQNQLS